jgi:hypothetical protein
MPVVRSFWTNFSAGWLTDDVEDRIDLDAYRNGVSRLVNWRQKLQGGITRRPGLKWDFTTDLPVGTTVNMKPFEFDAGEAYVFVFSPLRLDIFDQDGGFVQTMIFPAGADYWQTDAQVEELDLSQEGDVAIVVQRDIHIWAIRRTGLLSFEVTPYEFQRDTEHGYLLQPFAKYAPLDMTIRLSDEDLTTSTALMLQTDVNPAIDVSIPAVLVNQGNQVVHNTTDKICGSNTKDMAGGNVANDLIRIPIPPQDAAGGAAPDADLLDLVDNNFTIEGDLIIPSTGGNVHNICGQWPGVPNNSWKITYDDGPGSMRFHYSTDGTDEIIFAVDEPTGGDPGVNGREIRLSVTRIVGELYWHIDGEFRDTHNIGAAVIFASTGDLSFGGITESNADNRSITIGQWLIDNGTPRHPASDYFPVCPLTSSVNAVFTTATVSDDYWLDPEHIGISLRIEGSGEDAQGAEETQYLDMIITGIQSPTVADVALIRAADDGTFVAGTTTRWAEQAFSDIYGWPIAVLFHDQRLIFGGSKTLPNGYWASAINQLTNFEVGQGLDDDAIAYRVQGKSVANIRSLIAMRGIQLFSAEQEFFLPISTTLPMTPSNMNFVEQTFLGSNFLRPQQFDGAIIFVPKSGASVREFLFSEAENAFNADSVSALSAEILKTPTDLAVQLESPGQQEQYAFFVNDDGTMPVFMSMRREKISGWSLYQTEGVIRAVESVNNKVFCLVERDLGSGPVMTLEHYDPAHTLDASIALTSETPTRIWDGLDHLAEKEVHVRSGDWYLGTWTVDAAGRLTMPDTSDNVWCLNEIEAGLSYRPKFISLNPDVQLADGITWGQPRKVVRTVLKLKDTLDVSVQGTRIQIRGTGQDLTKPPERVSRDHEFRILGGWDFEGKVEVVQEAPLAVTVKAFMVEVEF